MEKLWVGVSATAKHYIQNIDDLEKTVNTAETMVKVNKQ